MAEPAKAKTKTISAKTSKTCLQDVYTGVETLLRRYAPPLKVGEFTVRGKESLQLVTPKPIVIPGAYGGKPTNWQFAAAILQKGYVGFYLMGVYNNAALRKKLSPALLKALKGKSCFHLKALDEALRKDIASALEASAAIYKERGWV
jgi:hypothetical protein